jgi:large subunit ribosomal protein L4
MEVEVYSKDGKPTGAKVTLAAEIFEITPNDHAIFEAVNVFLANQRQGTHKTKTYGEVQGSGRKLWKQKHTGRARIGAVRSPLWKGGGSIFGPVPRDYSRKLPKQIKQLARKSALSHKAKESAIRVVEDFTFDAPSSKGMAAILKSLELSSKKILLLTAKTDAIVWKSGRNIAGLAVLEASKASTYEILNNEMLLIQQSAVEALQKTFAEKA